jgi:hypothetical protein
MKRSGRDELDSELPFYTSAVLVIVIA